MKERRILRMDDLRGLCIKKSWYTRGDCEAYGRILRLADGCYNITTEAIVEIAEDIFNHSDKDYWKECECPIQMICFEIARVCHTLFLRSKQ